MTARHTSVTEQTMDIKLFRDDKMDNGFQYLRNKPGTYPCHEKRIGKDIIELIHTDTPVFCVRFRLF
jgi:hypothetical protein